VTCNTSPSPDYRNTFNIRTSMVIVTLFPSHCNVSVIGIGATFIRNYCTCPRGLRHELSSPVRTLGSWVRITLEACMFAFILSLCCPV
jgi:hypothetical protein